ncbi:NUDIX domain-containing protein [Patescibacteria group bacterium]|nr:NUDIX domain-containing protein [Patescibacteria group bacterium]
MISKINPQVKIGIGVLVFKNGKVLLAKRIGSFGAGEYGGPGGHLEFGESIIGALRRECQEEAGIEIKNIKFLCLSNIKKYSGRHYIDIGLTAEWKKGKPKVLELQKCQGWAWYGLNDLPQPLFVPVKSYLKALKSSQNFFDEEKTHKIS